MTVVAQDQLSPDSDVHSLTKTQGRDSSSQVGHDDLNGGNDVEFGIASPLFSSPVTRAARQSSRSDSIDGESPIHIANRAKASSLKDTALASNRSPVHSIRVRQGSRVDSLSESYDSRRLSMDAGSQDDTVKVNEILSENPL